MDPSWKPGAPCCVGDNIKDIDTPALVIDLDVMDYNRQALKDIMEKFPGVAVRPHAKAHKCPMIARLQVGGTEATVVTVFCQSTLIGFNNSDIASCFTVYFLLTILCRRQRLRMVLWAFVHKP